MKIPKFVLSHRATVIPFIGSGAYGPIWETDPAKIKKNVPCLIEPKVQRITSFNGTDVTQQANGVFHPDWKIRQGDKVQHTDKKTGEIIAEYTVQTVTPIEAFGPHSTEVVLV